MKLNWTRILQRYSAGVSCKGLVAMFWLIVGLIAIMPITVVAAPHAQVGGLEVTFARAVTSDHHPIEPTKVFDETDRTVYIAFRNVGSDYVRADVNVFASDVDGFEPNSRFWRNAWVQLPAGQRLSLRLDGPEDGLPPGIYRVEIDVAGSRHTSMIEVEPLYPYALTTDEADLAIGYNLALEALGASVTASSQHDNDRWATRNLIDGKIYERDASGQNCRICGWSSTSPFRQPQDIVIDLAGDVPAKLQAVVINTLAFENKTAWLPKHVEIWTAESKDPQHLKLIKSARLRHAFERQLVPLPETTVAKLVRVRILSLFDSSSAAVIGEVEVWERDSRTASVLDKQPFDIARPALGGALVRYTGYSDHQTAALLFDANDRGTSWRSYDRYFPQDFTVAFKEDRVALIEKVRLSLSDNEDPSTWPSEIAIAVSPSSPLDGFVEIARFPVEQRPGPQTFPVNQEARFVKVRLLDNYGAEQTSLSEVAVIEGRRDEYIPVLLRDTVTPRTVAAKREEQEQADDDAIAEVEPNDDLASANDLPLGNTSRGKIDPLGELDFFALPDFGVDVSALTLDYSGQPYIRHGLSLLDGEGGVISHFDPGDLPASDARLTFALSGDEKYLKLSEPPASVVVIWDTSGSMQGSEQDLERAVREYIRRAPPNQRMNLIRFSNDVQVLLPDFTADKSRLQGLLDGKFQPQGGTRLYDAILEGMQLLEGVQGNRAIVVMTDGEDNGETWHDTFWREIEQNRIRLYTIGLGRGLANYSPVYATSGERILQHLALGTDGDSFSAAESEALSGFYGRIADELSRPATYLLTPSIERGFGKLRLVATAEQVPSAAMPAVHVIYDLSGSMLERGPGGQQKYVLAQKAVYAALDSLPDGAPFGFTVYGARIPERAGKDKACKDIVTLQELGPLDKQVVRDFVARQRPSGGTTPLTASVRHVANNFSGKNGGIIIVVTDGIEECDSHPIETMEALKSRGLQYLEINVVGFALKDPAARKMMETIAEVGGGRYFDAADADGLAQALKEAMAARYSVRDAADRVVASGTIDGGDVTFPAGFFRVDIAAAGAPIRTRDVRIEHDHITTVRVNKVGKEVDVLVEKPRSLAEIRQARQDCGAAAASRDPAERTRRVQEKLNQLGFDVGVADNQAGPKTRRGIQLFQEKFGLSLNTEVSLLLEQHLDCVITTGEVFLAESDLMPKR